MSDEGPPPHSGVGLNGGASGRYTGRETQLVRGGQIRSPFDETCEPIFATSGYVYPNALEAELAFKGESTHYRYSRLSNPTVKVFEERLRLLEGAERCFATATGMAAVFAALASQLVSGSRVVASRSLFGSCAVVLTEILPRWGVGVILVDGTGLPEWEQALTLPTEAVFLESPSNPTLDLVDIRTVSEMAHRAGAKVIVDNALASPILQRPLELGADIVTYSATKHIDGQGRVLGGAILGDDAFFDDHLLRFVQHTGPALSPFNAWVFLKGLETMSLRVDKMSSNAQEVASFLEGHPAVSEMRYPGLESHPQSTLARQQMLGGGTMVAFFLETDRDGCYSVLDALELVDISNNFGDAKTLITHPATTTHHALGAAARHKLGIHQNLLRLSVGLENSEDLIADLAQALDRI